MFFKPKEDFKILLDENKRIYKELEEQYLKLRKEHCELLKKYEDFEIIEDEYKDTIEKLVKELSYKTELLSAYHLKFGEECAALIEKKCSKKNKNNNDEGVEL
ncbi:hypothetical protein [Clostridium perfringens]|uniref:hypothetical protein n=1 Tax=Clostridium perfringens TaxID=1502 RepID=UPI001ABB7A51|nr:hypothetical protein [Clostridium perfringens]MBO3314524.1 hypothetical protein [Clostridium perfringens]